MKYLTKLMGILLALVMCLGMAACGGKGGNDGEVTNNGEVSDDGEISIEDLEGFWYPVDGIGSTMSALTCFYIDGAAGTWKEYDRYGNPTGSTGDAYTDGEILTLADVPLIGDADVPIGDADTLLDETGEIYWIKGQPDFKEKPELSSSYYGNWYLRGDHDSEYATVLTLNEDGTYSWYGTEGTYTYSEFDENVGDTTVSRRKIELSASAFDMYYLVSDGQVLTRWSEDSSGDDYYIHEDALENTQLLTEYQMTDGESYWSEDNDYTLQFLRDHTLICNALRKTEERTGTWELSDGTITIVWNDGETDKAILDPENADSLTLSSTGKTFAKLF